MLGVVVLLTASPVSAHDAVKACQRKHTGGEQKECIGQLHRVATAELEVTYQRALDAARKLDAESKSGGHAQAIMASQKAFEAYRDAECSGVIGNGQWSSGTAVMVYGCHAEKNFARIQELKVPFTQR